MVKKNISDLSIRKLKEILGDAGLSQSGSKADLVQRLAEYLESDEVEIDMTNRDESITQLQEMVKQLTLTVGQLTQVVAVSQNTCNYNSVGHQGRTSNTVGAVETEEAAGDTSGDTIPEESNVAFQNVRDLIEIMPEFNPSDDIGLTSTQFINRINQLKEAYKWNEKVLLFSIQAKLQGQAKLWIDSTPRIFTTWNAFVTEFLETFPTNFNQADVHISMMSTRRRFSESVEDYFYRLCAKGRRYDLDDSSIIKYVRLGLNYPSLQNAIASTDFFNTNDLITAIRRFVENSKVKCDERSSLCSSAPPRPKENLNSSNMKPRVELVENKHETNDKRCKNGLNSPYEPVCYNCFDRGHLSLSCPKPQRRPRCEQCQKSGHLKENCPNNLSRAVRRIENDLPLNIIKEVAIDGIETEALIDSGSECSLIQRSVADLVQGEVLNEEGGKCLKGFGGVTIIPQSRVECELKIDDTNLSASLQVVADELIPKPILLGADVLCQRETKVIIENDKCRIENVSSLNVSLEHLPIPVANEVKSLLNKYTEVIASNTKQLGRCRIMEMEIRLINNKPINRRPYRIPFAKRDRVRNIITDLLKNEIIRESKSAYASPIVLVKKSNGEDRLCIDYRALNEITIKEPFPMPVVEEQLSMLADNEFFTTLDFMSGYHQIPIEETSKQCTAFVTNEGHFEFNRMPFGLVNAPGVFQKTMNLIANQMKPGEIVCYLDDVIIPSKTYEQGLERLERFLKILSEVGLTLRLTKCNFLAENINFLGHRVSAAGIQPGESKLDAVRNFADPTNVTEVRRFLGLTGFFRKFIENYAQISKPMTKLLKANNKFEWNDEQRESFECLKRKLCEKPVLEIYDPKTEHQIHTDASSVGLAGVLMQKDTKGNWKPVFYYSRHCTDAEQNYHSHELEVLAIVESLERFRMYVLGKHFQVVTDCGAVSTTRNSKPLVPRIARWFLKLQEYNFDIIHRPATRMKHADALSRAPVEAAKKAKIIDNNINRIEVTEEDWILTMQRQDPKLDDIIKTLKGVRRDDQIKQIKADYCLKLNRLYRRCKSQDKLVVPAAVRWRIVKSCHDDVGHFGLEKTIQRIEKNFWFPRIRKYVREYIAACIQCCYNKSPRGKSEATMYCSDVNPVPFRVIHMDHLGPFIRSQQGNMYVLLIVDRFSKYAVVKAVKTTKTQPVLAVLKELSSYFGLPSQIITDRGTSFTSRLFEQYCNENGIAHAKVAVRTPRANGQAERVNQSILDSLRTTVEKNRAWDQGLHKLQWSLNSQRNATTNHCPNEIVFNFPLRDLVENRLIQCLQDETAEERLPSTAGMKYEEISKRIAEEQRKWKTRFDRSHKSPRIYKEGDYVVIGNIAPASGESRKLEPKYKGPYVVTKVLDKDRYVIEDIDENPRTKRKFCSISSTEQMKPWCSLAPDIDGLNISEDEDYYPAEAGDRTGTVRSQDRPSCQVTTAICAPEPEQGRTKERKNEELGTEDRKKMEREKKEYEAVCQREKKRGVSVE